MSAPEYHNGDELLRTICGSLKSCIDSHGPITKEWVGSAAKRIVGLVGVKAAEVARLRAQLAESERLAEDARVNIASLQEALRVAGSRPGATDPADSDRKRVDCPTESIRAA